MTLLAAAALGAVAVQGCTVTSSTDTNLDGGSSGNNNGTSGSNGTSGGNEEPDAEAPASCELNGKQEKPYEPASCQSCMEANCCTQMQTCYDLTTAGETEFNCNQLFECVLQCANEPPEGQTTEECQQECAEFAPEAVLNAFDEIVACGANSCSGSNCAFE